MSQESTSSTCSQISMLSQETFDTMWKSVTEFANNGQNQIAVRDSGNSADVHFTAEDGDASLQIDRYQIVRGGPSTIVNTYQLPMQSQSISTYQNIPAQPSETYFAPTFNVLQNININTMQPLPTFPSNVPFAGEYEFTMSLSTQSKETKAVDWTYSEPLHKVFVRFGQSCPFRFRTSSNPPIGTKLRAMPIYTRPQHIQEVVRRCPTHAAKETAENSSLSAPLSHLVRCEHKLAHYSEDPYTEFHSVSVPYEHPAGDVEWTTYLYQFMCFSSCVGGLNRRPVQIVFTLERSDDYVLGRQAIEVRICACPGRDRQAEEKNCPTPASSSVEPTEKLSVTSEIMTVCPPAKRRKIDDDELFTISVRGRENYEVLHRLRDSLEVASAIPRNQFDKLRRQHEEMRKTHSTSQSLAVHSTTCSDSSSSIPDAPSNEPLAVEPHSSPSPPVVKGIELKSEIIDNSLESWLNERGLSSCLEKFHSHHVLTVSQLHRLSLAALENIGLSRGHLALIWLDICQGSPSTARITGGSNTPLSASCPPDIATNATEAERQTGNMFEVTRYTFKRMVSVPKENYIKNST